MNIKLIFFDVDGTLTDGKIYMGEHGEVMKAFDIKDGYGIAELLPKNQITPIIITGRTSTIVELRTKELHITELYQGKKNKVDTLLTVMRKYSCQREQAAYFGDDVMDIPAMLECDTVGCPADAVDEVKEVSHYICQRKAGYGAAREFIEWVIAQQ